MVVSKRQNTLQDRIVRSLKEKGALIPVAFLTVLLIDIAIFYALLLSSQSFCLALIGIGVLTPYGLIFFRIKEPKKLLILTTILFLILGAVFTVMSVENLYSKEPVLYSSDGTMKEGTVEPYIGSGSNSSFDFSVMVSSEYLKKENTSSTVYLNITDENGKESHYIMSNISTVENGAYVKYGRTLNLGKGVYSFFFSVKQENTSSVSWKKTDRNDGTFNGVLNIQKDEYILSSLPTMYLATFMYFGFLSYILIGMYWWTRIAKEKKRRMVTVRKGEDGEGLKCPVCGNRIDEDTKTCPYCGAELEHEEDEKVEKDESEE